MHFIPREQEKALPMLWTDQILPQSYVELMQDQNGGYVENMRVPTEEPTSDGLDFALLHYIFGMHELDPYSIFHQYYPELPAYLVVFSANDSQLFAFDYSQVDVDGEPAIRYLDIETDNWQTVAKNFSALLVKLEPHELELPLEGSLTRFEAEHALLLAKGADRVTELLLHLETTENKSWYLEWIAHFARHKDEAVRMAALNALETQVLFFRLQLPSSVEQVLQAFLEDEATTIREQAVDVQREWEEL